MDPPWEYASEQNVRLLLAGAGSGALAVALLARLRTVRGEVLGLVAPALALFVTGWWGWPEPSGARLAAVVVLGGLAGLGYERLAAGRGHDWLAPLVFLACCGGVWLGVPENSPVTALMGVVLGLAVLGRALDVGLGYGLGLALGWTVLIGARSTGWSFDGGLLALAPLAVVPALWRVVRGRGRGLLPPWPVYVATSGLLAFAAARWVGVAPDATWARVAVVGVGAATAAVVCRR